MVKLAYVITNRVNGKQYIGITTQSLEQRWNEHMCRYNRGDRDHKLYLAMKKHGPENFYIRELVSLNDDMDLGELEKALIKEFNTFHEGYNMTEGGNIVSDETREKISAKLKGRVITWSDKIVASRMRNPNRKLPQDYVAKGAKNGNAKKYTVIFPNGDVQTIHGLRAFCKEHGLSHNLMIAVLQGKQHHHKGFVMLPSFNDYPETEYSQAAGNGAHPSE